jgi:hypothetical protein
MTANVCRAPCKSSTRFKPATDKLTCPLFSTSRNFDNSVSYYNFLAIPPEPPVAKTLSARQREAGKNNPQDPEAHLKWAPRGAPADRAAR